MKISSYLALNRRAVLEYLRPVKSDHFTTNYFATVVSLRAGDPYSLKCFRSIYLVWVFQSLLQLYLYLCPLPWHRLLFFDLLDVSNNYPNWSKLYFSAFSLLSVYMTHMLYGQVSRESCFGQLYDYYVTQSSTFVRTPPRQPRHLLVLILNAWQVFPLAMVPYLSLEYLSFTVRIFRGDTLWMECVEFVCMNIFFVCLSSAFSLCVYISYTCIFCTFMGSIFIFLRFRETHRPLAYPCCRLTTLRLVRFVEGNIGTMQYIFSLNRLYGPVLLAYHLVNLPANVVIAIYLTQNRFHAKQKLLMLIILTGQLSCFFGVHLLAAILSNRIHSPYKRIQSLNLLVRHCPLRVRTRLANSIQAFHVKNRMYGITYGTGKWTFGLVTMMSFTKFLLLYGELLMSQYSQRK